MLDINGNEIKVGDRLRRVTNFELDYKEPTGHKRMYKDTFHTAVAVSSMSVRVDSDPDNWSLPEDWEIVPTTSKNTGTFFVAQIITTSNGESYSRKGDLFYMIFETYDEAEKYAVQLAKKTNERYAVTQLHSRITVAPVYTTKVERA